MEKKTILIVDDSPENLTVLYKILRDGYKVVGAGSGTEALRLAAASKPDMILLDVMMPDMNGFEVCRILKGQAALKEIPIIFITALLEEADEARGFKEGAVDYITKPFKPSILKHRISTHLELKSQKDLLRESDEHHRAILHTAMDGIWLADIQGRFLEVNETYCRMSGYSSAELLSMSISDVEGKESTNETAMNIARIIEQGEERFESVHHRKDGTTFDVEVSARYRPVNGGQFVVFIHDITRSKQTEKERQLLEQQFQQAQKLESLGVLAGGIAHDFNNILTVIISTCYLVQMRPQMVGELLPKIETSAQRAADLCRQMLDYAGKSMMNMQQNKMAELVDGIVRMLRSTINQNVEIISNLSEDLPAIKCDASQLRQVVMNLIINASEAIGDMPGTIQVSLVRCEIRDEQAINDLFGTVIPAGWYACLKVADNGCGMDEETRNRLFEPFFTTKFTGRGLGMSATLGIIKAHNGALQCSSKPNHGTTFTVYLPIQLEESCEPVILCHDAPTQWQGSGLVLLVEDEEHIAFLAKAMLLQMGFTVIAASNGKEALELYHQHASDIILVLTDMDMPVMDGYMLFRELKKINPQLPIVISSGFAEKAVTMRIPSEEIAGLVSKPYLFGHLRDVLEKAAPRLTTL
ncbi:MAG: response regulator [Desulfuromonadaceae bacterium]